MPPRSLSPPTLLLSAPHARAHTHIHIHTCAVQTRSPIPLSAIPSRRTPIPTRARLDKEAKGQRGRGRRGGQVRAVADSCCFRSALYRERLRQLLALVASEPLHQVRARALSLSPARSDLILRIRAHLKPHSRLTSPRIPRAKLGPCRSSRMLERTCELADAGGE